MPELPEVEIVRRGLEPVLVGKRFRRVRTFRPDLRFPLPQNFVSTLEGRRVESLRRRAKYLLAKLSGGDVLVMHLGMTGTFTVRPKGETEPVPLGEPEGGGALSKKHDHVVFEMSDGGLVTYNDPRRFGFMLLVSEDALDSHPLFKGLGVEPLGNEMNSAYLARKAAGRRTSLKAFLMDQRIVAGLGNIYACEALFRARLKPSRPAASFATKTSRPTPLAERLAAAIPAVLDDAIRAGGSTLRDYRRTDGSAGGFQNSFSVYGREGEPCVRAGCRGIVRRSIDGGRSTFYCPLCQR